VGEAEGGAEEEVAETEVVADVGARDKCKGMKTWSLHELYFFMAGTELRILHTQYSKKLTFIS